MPTPSPIIVARVTPDELSSSTLDERQTDAEAEHRGQQGDPHGDDRAERKEQDDHRHSEPDELAAWRFRCVRVDHLAAEVDLHTHQPCVLARRVERVDRPLVFDVGDAAAV
jgi:hypothetical protein